MQIAASGPAQRNSSPSQILLLARPTNREENEFYETAYETAYFAHDCAHGFSSLGGAATVGCQVSSKCCVCCSALPAYKRRVSTAHHIKPSQLSPQTARRRQDLFIILLLPITVTKQTRQSKPEQVHVQDLRWQSCYQGLRTTFREAAWQQVPPGCPIILPFFRGSTPGGAGLRWRGATCCGQGFRD